MALGGCGFGEEGFGRMAPLSAKGLCGVLGHPGADDDDEVDEPKPPDSLSGSYIAILVREVRWLVEPLVDSELLGILFAPVGS